MDERQEEIQPTFVKALRDKYLESDNNDDAQEESFVNIVFIKKQRVKNNTFDCELPHLQNVVLVEMGIGECGIDQRGLTWLCPNVCDLDLSNNNFSSWQDIIRILECLPHIKFANFSRNNINCAENQLDAQSVISTSLVNLVLNSTNVCFGNVSKLLKRLPSVSEIHLCDNGYETLCDLNQAFQAIKCIRLNGNRIASWDEVRKLNAIPELQTLILSDNPLCDVIYDSVAANNGEFAHLHTLCVSNTRISSYGHLRALSQFPALRNLRIKGCDFGRDLDVEEARKLLLACLENITTLNGGEVSENEVQKAQRHFIRYFCQRAEKPDRYNELVAIHGELEPLPEIDLGRKFREFVTLKIKRKNEVIIEDTFCTKISVGELRQKVSRRIKTPTWCFRMYHYPCGEEHENNAPELEWLCSDTLQLSRFEMFDGDEIHVDEDEEGKKSVYGWTAPKIKKSFETTPREESPSVADSSDVTTASSGSSVSATTNTSAASSDSSSSAVTSSADPYSAEDLKRMQELSGVAFSDDDMAAYRASLRQYKSGGFKATQD